MMNVKPAFTIDQQIQKLKDRGCIIADDHYAYDVLQSVNYYRLTAYLLPFKNDNDTYKPNTSTTLLREWTYTQKRPYKQDEITAPRRIYLHIYFNSEKYVEDEAAFDRKLLTLKQDLENGTRYPQYETFYKKYFTIKETPVRGVKVIVNEEAVKVTKRYDGFFTLVSNEKMTT